MTFFRIHVTLVYTTCIILNTTEFCVGQQQCKRVRCSNTWQSNKHLVDVFVFCERYFTSRTKYKGVFGRSLILQISLIPKTIFYVKFSLKNKLYIMKGTNLSEKYILFPSLWNRKDLLFCAIYLGRFVIAALLLCTVLQFAFI